LTNFPNFAQKESAHIQNPSVTLSNNIDLPYGVRGQRGERVDLSVCLRIIATLGGDLVDLARDLGFEEVARILELGRDKQRLLLDFLELPEQEGPAAEKFKQEIEFL